MSKGLIKLKCLGDHAQLESCPGSHQSGIALPLRSGGNGKLSKVSYGKGSRSNSSMYFVKHTPGSCSYDTVLSRLALTASLAVQRRYQHNHQNSLHVHLCCLLTSLGQFTTEDVVLFSPHLRITFAVRGTLQHVNIARRSRTIIRARI